MLNDYFVFFYFRNRYQELAKLYLALNYMWKGDSDYFRFILNFNIMTFIQTWTC